MERSLFEDPQQFYLQREGHVADLVEEQHAAKRALGVAQVPLVRAGKRALLMAEHFAFQQIGGNGGAIDRHERTLRRSRDSMKESTRYFLAGTGFSCNQNGHGSRRDAAE